MTFQSLGSWSMVRLSSRPSFLSWLWMSVQAQSISGSTSHLPWLVPPQGPLTRPLAQRVMGQMAP